jgi:hypothetical protein
MSPRNLSESRVNYLPRAVTTLARLGRPLEPL